MDATNAGIIMDLLDIATDGNWPTVVRQIKDKGYKVKEVIAAWKELEDLAGMCGCVPEADVTAELKKMVMKLSKRIPARTKTIAALWCRKDFTVMGPGYRAVRSKMTAPMDSCYWCSHKIADGETIALACFEKIGNKVLCQKCAEKLIASESSTVKNEDSSSAKI